MDCRTFAPPPFHTLPSFHCSCLVRNWAGHWGRGPELLPLRLISLSPAELFRVISASLTQRTSPQQFIMFHLCSVLVISWSFYNCSTVSQDKFKGTEERGKSRNNLLLLGERLNLLRYKDIWLDTLHLIVFFFFPLFLSLFLPFFLFFCSLVWLKGSEGFCFPIIQGASEWLGVENSVWHTEIALTNWITADPRHIINSLKILPELKMYKDWCADFSFPTECCVSHTHAKRKKGRFLFKINLTVIGESNFKVSKYLWPA